MFTKVRSWSRRRWLTKNRITCLVCLDALLGKYFLVNFRTMLWIPEKSRDFNPIWLDIMIMLQSLWISGHHIYRKKRWCSWCNDRPRLSQQIPRCPRLSQDPEEVLYYRLEKQWVHRFNLTFLLKNLLTNGIQSMVLII